MPVDPPKAGETQDEYLAYCIPEEIKSGKESDVAAAICYSYYREDKMSKFNKLKNGIKAIKSFKA
jgi:hypothetical protein